MENSGSSKTENEVVVCLFCQVLGSIASVYSDILLSLVLSVIFLALISVPTICQFSIPAVEFVTSFQFYVII